MDERYDVVVVGFGPCGQLMAAELGRRGHSVLVLERSTDRYPLPRAGHVDDEIVRALQGIGIAEGFAARSVTPRAYEWLSADGERLFTIPWDRPTRSAWRSDYIFFQPDLEDLLEAAALRHPNVELRRGWELTSLEETATGVRLSARAGDRSAGRWAATGATLDVTARYVIGADGARSITRSLIGAEFDDFGFEETLSIVDVRLLDLEMSVDMPDAGQICDPVRPISLFRWLGRQHCRWEFMLMPGEDPEELVGEASCWSKLARWGLSPDNATIIRRTLYTFRSLICSTFGAGNVLLIGDAAHLMPPFLGQGMASGMRDVENLAWKLDLVLRRLAPPDLLSSYTSERRPHVQALTEIAMDLGRILCETDPDRAAARDRDLRAGRGPEAASFPGLADGIFDRTTLTEAAGTLAVQGVVARAGVTDRLESFYVPGWHVLVRTRESWQRLKGEWGAKLHGYDAHVLHVSKAELDDKSLVDRDGVYDEQFRRLKADVVVVRPDRYIYGASSASDADELLRGLVAKLGHPNGTTTPVSRMPA